MSELEGMTFLEEVRYDLHQMKLRFGDEIDADEDKTHHPLKAQFTVQEDDKDVEKDDDEKDDDDDDKDNDDDKEETVVEIQPLESEPEPASNLPPAGDKVEQHGKSHGEIVVTSFEPKKAEAIKPVNTVPVIQPINSQPLRNPLTAFFWLVTGGGKNSKSSGRDQIKNC